MYKLVLIDFNGFREVVATGGKDSIKKIYESYIKRCVYGFLDIMEVLIETDTKIISSFVNWRR